MRSLHYKLLCAILEWLAGVGGCKYAISHNNFILSVNNRLKMWMKWCKAQNVDEVV
jgi:hypothetical protein